MKLKWFRKLLQNDKKWSLLYHFNKWYHFKNGIQIWEQKDSWLKNMRKMT